MINDDAAVISVGLSFVQTTLLKELYPIRQSDKSLRSVVSLQIVLRAATGAVN
jgi:hypothetical protein